MGADPDAGRSPPIPGKDENDTDRRLAAGHPDAAHGRSRPAHDDARKQRERSENGGHSLPVCPSRPRSEG